MTKIGIFDSGIGGVTVLHELQKNLNSEVQYVYLGDTANLPYGTKSPAQIEKLSIQCARMLRSRNVDLVVVACNTASSWALGAIQQELGSLPVIGMVQPGVQAVQTAFEDLSPASQNEAGILILATRATVRSGAYGKELKQRISAPIYEKACPLLVPLIEEGWMDHPVLHQVVAEYVEPYQKLHSAGVALLGCTHYPWIHSAFERALPGWKVVNSAQSVVESLFYGAGQSDLIGVKFSGCSEGQSSTSITPKNSSPVEWIFTDPEAVPDFIRAKIL